MQHELVQLAQMIDWPFLKGNRPLSTVVQRQAAFGSA